VNTNTQTLNLYLRKSQTIPLYITGFTSSSSLEMNISENSSFTVIPSFITRPTIVLSGSSTFSVESPSLQNITYTLDITSGSSDCTGRKSDLSFSDTGNILYVGYDANGIDKSWIPFTTTFGVTRGIYLVSASLISTAADTEVLVDGAPCKIKVACDKTINSVPPTNWNTLNGKTMTMHYYSSACVPSWIDGESYGIDITTSVKDVLGTDAITWNDGDELSVLLQDFGSSKGSYRTITSYEGNIDNPSYAAPVLELVYANTYYTDSFLDTYITSANTTQKNYNSPQVIVGEYAGSTGVQRGLVLPVVNGAVSASATITSASLCLYQEGRKSSNTRTMSVYRMLKPWDLYGTSWVKYYGTSGSWTTAGGFASADCEQTPIGSISLASNEANGWKNIHISGSYVQQWTSGSVSNYGLMLKMDTESNDAHIFTSSQGLVLANHPKMIIYYTIEGTPYTATIQV
jgi:hypothetical protein